MDVRDTPISDSDIQCFNITLTLREILLDCPAELRETYATSDETISDTDDNEPYEMVARNDKTVHGKHSDEENHNHKKNGKSQKCNASILSDTESESDEESECSSDSEDGNSDDENGRAKAASDDTDSPNQAHCIQVILQNGRMIQVNAERSNESDNQMREQNGLRCVIGIINGRGMMNPDQFVQNE